jgi:hypothetical protein
LKEQILASRKLKELGENEKNASKKYDITVFEEAEAHSKEDKSNFDQWQDIIKSKETRYFQIGRVIKFLSD